MGDDVYRRAGRGGAGNYYSKRDIAEVDKRVREQQQDVESQKPVPEDLPPSDPADPPSTFTVSASSSSSAAAYARSGRGGAGNFVDPVQQQAAASDSAAAAAAPAASSSSSSAAAAAAPRYQGRGGAGNFSHFNPSAAPMVDEEQERKRKETLESGVLKEIQESLPKPPKMYYLHGGVAGSGKERAKGPDM
ncbi:DUF3602 domain-containing protein [Microdochium nivale]|nr:DUF3602 domain-containing protein [Microdochium nivale]